MSQPLFDPSSKWMLEEQGASILYLAGERSVLSCRARKAEVVQPRKLPDGLLEARFTGSDKPSLVLVEPSNALADEEGVALCVGLAHPDRSSF